MPRQRKTALPEKTYHLSQSPREKRFRQSKYFDQDIFDSVQGETVFLMGFCHRYICVKLESMNLGILSILGLAVGLALDAFAVSISVGLNLKTVTIRHVFRLAFHFGLFQFLMPIIGWLAGGELVGYMQGYGAWIAFGLLTIVGGKMLWESRSSEKKEADTDPTRGIMLVTLSVATSLDALAVGVSMAMCGVSVWTPSIAIGIVTACLTTFGISLGSRLGARWSHWAEIIGGCVLILIGFKMLLGNML
jgi:manganese efflux pump family protein